MFANGPRIVTDGLVLCLDAANPNSYVSGSNTWYDLSGNNNSGSLINGVGYDNGSMVFDGVNDCVLFDSSFRPSVVDTMSFGGWFKPTRAIDTSNSESDSGVYGVGGQFYVFWPANYVYSGRGLGLSLGTNSIQVYKHGSYILCAISVFNASLSTNWNFIMITVSNKTASIYLNGVLVHVGLPQAPELPLYVPIGIGGDYGYFGGSIPIVSIYNRALSSQEVLQNFNATKGRFGL